MVPQHVAAVHVRHRTGQVVDRTKSQLLLHPRDPAARPGRLAPARRARLREVPDRVRAGFGGGGTMAGFQYDADPLLPFIATAACTSSWRPWSRSSSAANRLEPSPRKKARAELDAPPSEPSRRPLTLSDALLSHARYEEPQIAYAVTWTLPIPWTKTIPCASQVVGFGVIVTGLEKKTAPLAAEL